MSEKAKKTAVWYNYFYFSSPTIMFAQQQESRMGREARGKCRVSQNKKNVELSDITPMLWN